MLTFSLTLCLTRSKLVAFLELLIAIEQVSGGIFEIVGTGTGVSYNVLVENMEELM